MKTNMSKKKKIAALALSALAAASVCAVPVAAAETEATSYALEPEQKSWYDAELGTIVHALTPAPPYLEQLRENQEGATSYALEPAQKSWYDEELGTIVHALTPNPSYLRDADGITPHGAGIPSIVWDCSTQGTYSFNGTFRGEGKLYLDRMITGKYSYTVRVDCSSTSGTPVTCYAYNASSGDKLIKAITVSQGQSGTMNLTGLAKNSKVFLMFTGDFPATKDTRVSGTIG